MAKTLLLLILLIGILNLTKAADTAQMFQQCLADLSLEDEIAAYYMKNGEVPDETNKKQKCLFHCLLKKLEMADDLGNMDFPKIREMLVVKYTKMEPNDVVALINKCAVRSETDPCEKVYEFHKCHMKPYVQL